jgi:hypothetical protein
MWIMFLWVAVGIIGYLSARIQSDAIFWIVVVFVLIIVAGVGLLAFSFASSTPATTGTGK